MTVLRVIVDNEKNANCRLTLMTFDDSDDIFHDDSFFENIRGQCKERQLQVEEKKKRDEEEQLVTAVILLTSSSSIFSSNSLS